MMTDAANDHERTAPPITTRRELDQYGRLTGAWYVRCENCHREAMSADDLRHRETCPWRADDG